jgi:hypothetical protein
MIEKGERMGDTCHATTSPSSIKRWLNHVNLESKVETSCSWKFFSTRFSLVLLLLGGDGWKMNTHA